MKLNTFFAGLAIGVAAGAALTQVKSEQSVSAEKALKSVKNLFKEKGPIDGSWIHMEPEKVEKFDLPYTVYRGGITRTVNNQLEQYEFIVDTKSGALLEVSQS